MLIQITDTIIYDTDLPFESQTQECQDFALNSISDKDPVFKWDATNRPEAVWENVEFEIVKAQKWANTHDWSTNGETILIRERGVE